MSRVVSKGILYMIQDILFGKSVWQGFISNIWFALFSLVLALAIFLITKRSKLYKILGLNKIKRLTIYFSNTFARNATNREGNPDGYSGSAVPENEFKVIPEIFRLLVLIGEKDNFLTRFIKFLTFEKVIVDYELSPSKQMQVEANKESNIITIGGPAYNNATAFFQNHENVRLIFSNEGIVDKKNGQVIVQYSLEYDCGILEKIVHNGRTVIIAAGGHINGTRGSITYFLNNWKKLPKQDFAYVIKFPHPCNDLEGYRKPLEIKQI